MPNIFDQFDAASEAKDLASSFAIGSNQLMKAVGDVYGLTTGDMDNVVSRQGQENIDYLQRGKSEKLRQAEARRKAAVDAEKGTLNQAVTYAKESFTDPRLLFSSTAEAIPSLVGAGGIGAGARVAAGRVLGKKGAETAAKIGVGSAVAAGSGMQGTSVGAEQYSEVADILKKMPDEQAMAVPEIARLMRENGETLEEAKKSLTKNLARSTGALAAIASAGTQMLPGGRTIEKALVGGAGKKLAGKTLAQRGVGAAMGALGESVQEGSEEGSGAGLKNLLARAVEPERELTKGVGEAIGAGVVGTALLGGAAGAASRPSRPVPVGETTAGKSGEPQASGAISDIPVLESTTEQPSISLRDIENMSPEEFAAAIDVRDAASRGGKPRPEDVTRLENVRPGPIQESDTTIAPVQEALDEWRNQNADVGLNVTVINDPNLRNTRNYGIRGYFDPNTGEVVINSAFTKPFEVESVVNHEWSHHTLASDEGRAALAEFATRDIPATELSDLAKRYPNADNLTLVEEWIARNQEKSPGVFARIVAKIREWLNGKLGINMTNEEAARVMLRTLRERGAPVAEGSGEMRQSTTEQPVGEPESVRRDPGKSGMMASPSVVDINYDRAKRNLTSSDQARFRSDVEGFAPEATVYNAVGDWADGAENSVAAVFKDVRSSEELRQLAANAGLTGDQKAALWWRVEENGPDAIHQVTWPKEITMDEARQAMIDAGIENRTLIQTRDGVMGFVFDQGQQNLSKIDKLYESSTNPSTQSSPATGEFVGSWSTRIEGKRAYRNVLGLPTKTPESEGVSGLGVRSRGDAETGAETGSEPERSSVLAKQPIRESVTEEPVGQKKKQTESPEFKKWFGSSKVVDKQGKPLVMYHGTKADFTEFKSRFPDDDNLIFFTRNPEFASKWAQDRQAVGRNFTDADFESAKAEEKAWWKSEVDVSPVGDLLRKDGTPLTEAEQTEFWTETRKRSAVAMQDSADASVYPVFLKAEKIFDPAVDGKKLESFLKTLPNMRGAVERGMHIDGSWAVYENKPVTDWLRSRGYDAVRLRESSAEIGGEMDTLAVFSPTQIKSATGNRGTFDPTNPDIRFSVTEDPVDVADLPKNLRGDSEGFIPTYITKQNALPTVVGGKNKTVEIPVIDFSEYADKFFKARGTSELKGKEITLAEAHVPVIQKYYAGLSPETYQAKDVRAAADMVADDMSKNLLFLHDLALDMFGPEVVKRMSKWYDGANVIAKKFADQYGVSVEQSAAILATLSPQKHWFANVSLAENVMDVMRNHQDTVFDAAVEKAARASIKNSTGTTSSKRVLYEVIRGLSGKKLSDLDSLEEKTVFTRFLSQSLHPERAYVVTPEGKLTPGSSVAVAWSGVSITLNAVSAFLDGSVNNLTMALGGGHKVRDFYGNIVDPMSPFFYTSDTHNVAASLLLPVGGTNFEVSHNFGGNPGVGEGPKLPVIGTTVTGLQGTYPLYLEAGRRAAEQRNVLPRQMQSITWEMIRIMFTDDMKTESFMSSVRGVHDQVRSGSLSIDAARQKIIELSGGQDAIKARPPEWLNK